MSNKRNSKCINLNSKVIYVENLKHNETDRNNSIDTDHAMEEIKDIFKFNNGRVLKIEVTLSDNIYRDRPERNQVMTILGDK